MKIYNFFLICAWLKMDVVRNGHGPCGLKDSKSIDEIN